MRVRFIGISAALMLMLTALGLFATVSAAPSALQQTTAAATTAPSATKGVRTPTPVAAKTATNTPAPTETAVPPTETVAATVAAATETATASAGTPVAETPTEVPVSVVTLVLWYQQMPDSGPLKVGPILIGDKGVAGPGEVTDQSATGSVDFEDPNHDGLPRITLGDSNLDAYAVNPDDPDTVQRWIYYNDDSTARPSTLVMQITATAGPYKGYDGTATFVSRASKAGGVLVIALNPSA